jgi:hypothetical protein
MTSTPPNSTPAAATPLTDSYIAATLRRVPLGQRDEIERELRASIADAVEGRIGHGATPETAEFDTLSDLGDPARLAANYSGRTLALIGPDTYTSYLTALKVISWSVLPIVLVVVVAISIVQGKDVIGAIFGGIGQTIMVAVYLGFFVTLAFVFVDRGVTARERAANWGTEWSPKFLRVEAPPTTRSWAEPAWSVVGSILLIAAVIAQRTLSPVTSASGTPIPILAPDLWTIWIPFFLVVIVASLALDFARLGVGRWHPVTAMLGTLLTLAGTVPFVALLWQAKIVNPALWRAIGHPEWTTQGNWLVLTVALVVALVALGSIIEMWSKRSRRQGRARLVS